MLGGIVVLVAITSGNMNRVNPVPTTEAECEVWAGWDQRTDSQSPTQPPVNRGD